MSSPRLHQQFVRLWQCCQGQSQETTLQDLAQMLSCSRRHMRSLLSAMQQQGWLTWEAEAGRGKRSRLTFIYSGLGLQQQRAEDLLEQDRIEQLIQLLGDKDAVRQMLLSHLGRSFRQGKHLLRIVYYRPLLNLLPGTALRRSEIHIARQIFSGLTRINEENGELEPDLAHHWQSITPLHWRFYLRPAIRFHHGREMTMDDVISSLSRLGALTLFAHIQKIDSPTPFVIDVRLSCADRWLPWLLGSVPAMILPQEWRTLPDFARSPIGTGPYSVVRNNHSQLKIQAFDDYFGYRALIDEVNIWVLPEVAEELPNSIQLQVDDSSHNELESRLEEGCYFILYDQRSAAGARPEVRRWLSQVLSPIALLSQANALQQRDWAPAYSLLPRWHHSQQQPPEPKPAGVDSLTLTIHRDHPEYQQIGQIMATLLARHHVELQVKQVSYEQWHQGEAVSDMWLATANFYLPLEFSLFALLYEIPLLQRCLKRDLNEEALRWRADSLALAEWCRMLVGSQQLHPLFHHWLQLQGQRSMRGVRMNTLGWFDFKSAWFVPPENPRSPFPDAPKPLQ
ncbi:HTH-type transcriptional regulator SgrR [Affinibrenneria salicis]|uniref:HTH-type transcriptional regulator SgrR n=1 Tax=Affinibrenneria salicis TaxID=2590031 RepID=A0A5J5G606_9GAMM|nr:HTH-type transcriptional regulator SgrR [Affinibrenneria salicis]KAA9002617.1 HTH-type transcriptional regulator SgrR [Affinibrenneria salicis]KAA9003095.1 HTH-type transcriptional regulator SgrR [Affinibrenneria salicis]